MRTPPALPRKAMSAPLSNPFSRSVDCGCQSSAWPFLTLC